MDRHRVMNAGADLRGAQMLAKQIALAAADHVLVKDVARIGAPPRQVERQAGEPLVIAGGDRLAARIVGGEARQPGAQDRRLERVEPGVDADAGADITVAPAIIPS